MLKVILTLLLAAVALMAISCSQTPSEPTADTPASATPPKYSIDDDVRDDLDNDRRVDVICPRVVSTDPDSSLEAPWITDIHVMFSEDIDPASVDAQTFDIDYMPEGTVSVNGNVVTFDPKYAFDGAIYVEVRVSGEVRDLCGNTMGEDYVFFFCTSVDPYP
jgi:Bacterial Ig-like domain